MEYFLILLAVLVYGFVSLAVSQSFFPRSWEKRIPWLMAFFWGGMYLFLLFKLGSSSPLIPLILNFLLLAGVLVWARKRYRRELQAQRQLLAASERSAAQEQTIRALTAAYSAQKKMTHDFRHHISALQALLEQNEMEKARAYLAQLQESQTSRPLLVNCRHAAIDAVLNQKAYAAQEANIDFHCEVNDLSGVSIPDKDLAVVLGNLLDNALEACQRLSPGQVRWVRVKLLHSREDRQLFLSIENSSLPPEIKGDILPTTKADPTLHGYGLPNVFAVLKRYHADWTMNCREGVFLFALEWPEEPAL